MNKQEFRKKNKKHFHHKATDCDKPDTSLSGAIINNNTLENSMLDNLSYGFQESLSKAPDNKNSYNKVLISAIIFSAILAIAISISGAK